MKKQKNKTKFYVSKVLLYLGFQFQAKKFLQKKQEIERYVVQMTFK